MQLFDRTMVFYRLGRVIEVSLISHQVSRYLVLGTWYLVLVDQYKIFTRYVTQNL